MRKVTAVHINHDTDLADLKVRDGDGRTSIVHTTQHHRFWDDTHHGWVGAPNCLRGIVFTRTMAARSLSSP
jgi:hypothetical protein